MPAIRCSVTVSLVEEARGGPFVFWHDLPAAAERAAALGFHGIEVFPPSAEAVAEKPMRDLLDRHGLALAAVGTGGGWVHHKLSLTSSDESVRARAVAFVRQIIDASGRRGAPAILGSMQGRSGGDVTPEQAREHLVRALEELGEHAGGYGVPLLYEPLNRYESNLINTLGAGVELLETLSTDNVRLLADLFHMNIEERDLAGAIRAAAPHVGHVHFADSNRQAAGFGHTDFRPVVSALQEASYEGFVSAEVFPTPDSEAAAAQTMRSYRDYFGGGDA